MQETHRTVDQQGQVVGNIHVAQQNFQGNVNEFQMLWNALPSVLQRFIPTRGEQRRNTPLPQQIQETFTRFKNTKDNIESYTSETENEVGTETEKEENQCSICMENITTTRQFYQIQLTFVFQQPFQAY